MMNLEIRFRHMERSQALEDYVRDKAERNLEPALHRVDAHAQIWLVSDRNLNHRGSGWFVCEIDIRFAPRREVFVSNAATDMYVAIDSAIAKARKQVDELGKREDDQKRPRRRLVPPVTESTESID